MRHWHPPQNCGQADCYLQSNPRFSISGDRKLYSSRPSIFKWRCVSCWDWYTVGSPSRRYKGHTNAPVRKGLVGSVLLSIPDERLTSGETVKFCRERLEHKSEDTTISVSFCSLETLPVLLLDEPEFRARVAISEATRCGIVSTRALAKGLRALPTLASDRATQGQSH